MDEEKNWPRGGCIKIEENKKKKEKHQMDVEKNWPRGGW